MAKTTNLREAIFNKYSKNIELFHKKLIIQPEIDGKICNEKVYICPLCNRGYLKESLEVNFDNHLTLEHVPPEKLGGQITLLTCKECNNKSGEKLDAQLIWYINILEKGMDERAKVKINNQFKTSGSIKYSNKERPKIKIDLYPNSQLDKNFEELKDNWNQSTTNLKFKLPNPQTIQLSLLRIAFLMMYEKFGMGYLYSKSGQNLREIIYKNEVNRIKPFKFKPNIDSNIIKHGIYLMSTLDKRNGYLAIIHLTNEESGKDYNFFIPIPRHDEKLEDHLKLIMEKNEQKITISDLPNIDYLNDLDNLFFYRDYKG